MTGAFFGVRQDIPVLLDLSTFPQTGSHAREPRSQACLNHLTKAHREWSDRPHGMRIYDSIGGLRLRRTFEVFPYMAPLSLAEISRYFARVLIPLPALHMQA
jgi:hypothetical protein